MNKYLKNVNLNYKLIKFFRYSNIFFYIYEKVKLNLLIYKIKNK